MAISQIIPLDKQYGVFNPSDGEVRQSAVTSKIVEAIKRNLFDARNTGAPLSKDGHEAEFLYQEFLALFCKGMIDYQIESDPQLDPTGKYDLRNYLLELYSSDHFDKHTPYLYAGNVHSMLVLAPDGKKVGDPLLINFGSEIPVIHLAGHKSPVTKVSFSSDGCYIATLDFKNKIMIWQADRGTLLEVISTAFCNDNVSHISFKSNGVLSIFYKDKDLLLVKDWIVGADNTAPVGRELKAGDIGLEEDDLVIDGASLSIKSSGLSYKHSSDIITAKYKDKSAGLVVAVSRELDILEIDYSQVRPVCTVSHNVRIRLAAEELFCLTLYSFCKQYAFDWVSWLKDRSKKEGGDFESDLDRSDRAPDSVAFHSCSIILRNCLQSRQKFVRFIKREPKAIKDQDDGAELLTLFSRFLVRRLDTLPCFRFEMDGVSDQGKRTTPINIIPSDDLGKSIESMVESLPLIFTPQPLMEPVQYQLVNKEPSLKHPKNQDGQTIELIKYRKKNNFIRRLSESIETHSSDIPEFEKQYIRGINQIQKVGWRINRKVHEAVQSLIDIAKIVSTEHRELKKLIKKELYEEVDGKRKKIKRPADFLDNDLAIQALKELASQENKAFYLPWKADYRGRVYAETPWFTPQGGDVQRALLEFSEGQKLDDNGFIALKRHGANLVKRSKILRDLKIEGRQVLTFREREQWIELHSTDIRNSAADPIKNHFWLFVADKPVQFLAFCFAYHAALNGEDVYLPVQIDGTCNGLQHISALTGDVDLAKAVNVLKNDVSNSAIDNNEERPSDIYTLLSDVSVKNFDKYKEEKRNDILNIAYKWLSENSDRKSWISRKTAKKVLMTIPYGASPESQACGVLKALESEKDNTFHKHWDSEKQALLIQLREYKESAIKDVKYINKCCGSLTDFRYLKAEDLSDNMEASPEAKGQPEVEKSIFAYYVALAIVTHLRNALSVEFPKVYDFTSMLKDVAKSCKGLPLVWFTPLGFPVCQDKFKLNRSGSSTVTFVKKNGPERFTPTRLTESVDSNGQSRALLPNLIHSLDASHLIMTVNAAADQGIEQIGTIHDCLLCPPNQAMQLAKITRDEFKALYQEREGYETPLKQWLNWIVFLNSLSTVDDKAKLETAVRVRRDKLLNEESKKLYSFIISREDRLIFADAFLQGGFKCRGGSFFDYSFNCMSLFDNRVMSEYFFS